MNDMPLHHAPQLPPRHGPVYRSRAGAAMTAVAIMGLAGWAAVLVWTLLAPAGTRTDFVLAGCAALTALAAFVRFAQVLWVSRLRPRFKIAFTLLAFGASYGLFAGLTLIGLVAAGVK